MSDDKAPQIGSISWVDLTVPEAERARDFYREVVGWEPSPVDMGGYSDFNMNRPGSDEAVAGVCHARGVNAGLPPAWMIYIQVADADGAAARAEKLGGKVLAGPKSFGPGARYCVVQDPAGAVSALYSRKDGE